MVYLDFRGQDSTGTPWVESSDLHWYNQIPTCGWVAYGVNYPTVVPPTPPPCAVCPYEIEWLTRPSTRPQTKPTKEPDRTSQRARDPPVTWPSEHAL